MAIQAGNGDMSTKYLGKGLIVTILSRHRSFQRTGLLDHAGLLLRDSQTRRKKDTWISISP